MALVPSHNIKVPDFYWGGNPSTLSIGNGPIMDASGEKTGIVLCSPVTDTITKIGFRTGTITTGGDLDVRIETVGADGFPTGTLWGTNTNIVHTVSSTDDNIWVEVTLTSGASITAGDFFAIVWDCDATFNGRIQTYGGSNATGAFPMNAFYATSAWSVYAGSIIASLYGTTNGYIDIPNMLPISSNTNANFNNTSTPDVYGNVFSLSYNCAIAGVYLWADHDGNFVINLYGTDGVTVERSITVDADNPVTASPSFSYFYFSSPYTYTAGTTMRIGIEPSTSTSMTFYVAIFNSSDIRASATAGEDMYQTSAKDPTGTGSWTDDNTRLLTISLLINKIDDGSGGGGGGLAANPVKGFIA